LLAAYLATEPGGLTFHYLSDRAHLHTLKATLQPSEIQLCDRTDESFLQVGFGGHAHQRTEPMESDATARRGRNHPVMPTTSSTAISATSTVWSMAKRYYGPVWNTSNASAPEIAAMAASRAPPTTATTHRSHPQRSLVTIATGDHRVGCSMKEPSIVAEGPSTSSRPTCSIVRSK